MGERRHRLGEAHIARDQSFFQKFLINSIVAYAALDRMIQPDNRVGALLS